MKKTTILLAVKDRKYLEKTEWQLFSLLGNTTMIESVTQENYFLELSKQQKQYDIAVLEESFFQLGTKKFGNSCILLGPVQGEIPAYAKVCEKCELVSEICNELHIEAEEKKTVNHMEKTAGILCYSPIGGAGKTVISLAIAEMLGNKGYKVLYISTENLQNFQYYMENEQRMDAAEFVNYITNQDNSLYLNPKDMGHDIFDYLLPVDGIVSALGVEEKMYMEFLERILDSRTYDYVVFDSAQNLNEITIGLMEKCQNIICITGQSEEDKFKLENFCRCVDCTGKNILYVKNNCQETENLLEKAEMEPSLSYMHTKRRQLVHDIAQQGIWEGKIS